MDVVMIMFKNDGEQRVFKIDTGDTIIGRREDCDLRIPLSEISRKHALVRVSKTSVTLRDLDSANGTYVNNTRIVEQILSPGDRIVVGPVVFTIRINGEPAEVRPVKTRLEARSLDPEEDVLMAGKGSEVEVQDTADLNISDEDDDPISALEAMASSDKTAQLDLDDSHFLLEDEKD